MRVADLRPEHFDRSAVPGLDDRVGERDPPWRAGDMRARWEGYLDPNTGILLNLVGAQSSPELRRCEDDFVEWRALELRDAPVPQTFDLAHLQELHRRLFQDVYPWAGECRTVDMGKGAGPGFLPYGQVPELMIHVSLVLRD